MKPYPTWTIRHDLYCAWVKFRGRYCSWIWRLGLIKRTTAFRWEVDIACLDHDE